MSSGVRCHFALLTGIVLCGLYGQAEAQVKNAAEAPLLFRREFLPKSLLTREKEKLIPVPRKDFDQWLEAARSRAAGTLPQAWVESIELRAALDGTSLHGQAKLQIRVRKSGQETDEKTLLPLTGLKLPVMQPQWEGSEETATVGMTSDGSLLAQVRHSGTLTFDWHLAGRRDPFGAALFDVSVVESPRCNLSISLPAGSRLESSAGLLSQSPSDDASLETWKVELGGAHEARLRCITDGNAVPGPLVSVREESNCSVSQGELETQCQLRLDVYREPVAKLEVELIGEWTPTSIRQGDTQIPFQTSADGRTALLLFDPPLTGINRRLGFSGRVSVQAGQRVVVPRVRVKESAWLDGTLAVVATDVLLRDWELEGFQRPAGEQMPGVTRRWSLQSEQALAAFVVDRLPTSVQAETGTTVRLDVEGATASVVADFTAESGGIFDLEADVAPGWIIDSLETVPPQALDDWELVADDAQQLLRVRLRRSVSPTQPLRMTIEAHRPAPAPAENLGSDQLRPIRWRLESKGYLALGIDPLWQIGFRGAEPLQPIDPGRLTDAQNERLAIAEDVLLFADDEGFDSARLELAAESPQFTAEWQLRVGCDGSRFQQETELRVEPTATPVERLHMLVRPSAGKSVQWQMLGEDSSAMEARLVRASDDPAGEDEWELTLVRARRNPFTVLATTEGETDGRYPTRFFRCIEATLQPARIVLTSEPHSRPIVEQAAGLNRLWNDGVDSSDVAQWSFDAAQSPVLTLRMGTLQELRQLLLVKRTDLETRLTRQHLLHTVDYTVVNQQTQPFVVRLPPGSELDQVLVDDRRVDPRLSSDAGQLSIPLPRKATPLRVRIAFRTSQTSTGATALIQSVWPDISFPVAEQSWRIVFPDHYRQFTWSDADAWTWRGWLQRMQGPLPGFEPPHFASNAETPVACHQLEFHSSTGLPASLRLIDHNALRGLSWLLLAGCWAAMARLALGPRQLAWLIALLGLAALMLPTCLDPLGRMALLGCAAGLLVREMHQVPNRNATSHALPPLRAVATALLLATVVSAAWTTGLPAQEKKTRDVVHRVILPVDEAGKPVDDYIYVSEPFSKELYRRAHQPAAQGPGALFVSAEYRARPRGDASGWDTLDATLTIEALRAGPVQIPWPREGFVIPPERVRLDGRASLIDWNEEGTSFIVDLESPGRHSLQFVAQPTRRDDAKCAVNVPPAATARLLLDTLDDAAQVQAWPGPLAVSATSEVGVQTLELGQRRDVTLLTRPIDAPAAKIEAEQLIWTNLWRGGGVIEGRWRFLAPSETLTEAVVDVGAGLELLSAAALTPASVRWQHAQESSQLVWTPRAPTDELVVEAVFLWRNASTERTLPPIEPRGADVTRRWLAVDLRGNSGLTLAKPEEQIDVADFAALWNAEDWPLTAQNVAQAGPVLLGNLDTKGELTYDATTDCEITATGTHFQFRAEVKSLDDPPAFIRVALPPRARILSADVGVAGQFRAIPWLSLADDQIGLAATTPLRAGNVLDIRGELSPEASEQAFAPPSLVDGKPASYSVNVSRRSDVRVTVSEHRGFRPIELRADSSSTITVGRYELGGALSDAPQLQWTIEPNHPRTVGILVTTLRAEGQQWIARLDAFLAVRDGVADAFHLESSGGWNSPRLVVGDASLETKELPGGLRQMVLKPRGAPSNRYHFACEGVVPAPRVQVPVFRLLGAENVQQYVRLPTGENLAWTTSGIQEAVLPAAVDIPKADELAVYRIAVPQFHVELLATQALASAPRVAWGNVRVSSHAAGPYVATCDVVVDPAQSSALEVLLPPTAILVQAAVEGEAVVARLKEEQRVEIPLRSSVLPQAVRVVYSGGHTPTELDSLAPRFDSWKGEQPLSVVAAGQEDLPPSLRAIIPLLTAALGELPQPNDELATWASAWGARLKAAQGSGGDEATAGERQQAAELIDRLQAISQNIIADPHPSLAAETPHDAASPAVSPKYSMALWLAALAAWVGVVVGGYHASQSTYLQEFARRWPSAVAALIALGVALFVSPWIGGALLAVAAGSSLMWPWQSPARDYRLLN